MMYSSPKLKDNKLSSNKKLPFEAGLKIEIRIQINFNGKVLLRKHVGYILLIYLLKKRKEFIVIKRKRRSLGERFCIDL